MKNVKYLWKQAIVLVAAVLLAAVASADFLKMHVDETIVETENLTEIKMLSDYFDGLKGTEGDTPVYVFDSGVPGGTMLVLGGTHPNETAGLMATIGLIEHMKVEQGRVFVLPWTNRSGYSHTSPLDGMMDFIDVPLSDGSTRTMRIGNRLVNPVDQWPDRDYYAGTSGRVLVGTETPEIRNINRMYPGDPNGVLAEKICYGVAQLIRAEKVNVALDMHEGSPEFPYLDTTIAHERALAMASAAIMEMNLNGISMRTEVSGQTSYGLSHRALGDNTDALMTLMETYNPSMGPLHGKMDDELVMDGYEPNYTVAHRKGIITYNVRDGAYPLYERAARHMVCTVEIAKAFSLYFPDQPVVISGIGSLEELIAGGYDSILLPLA